MTLALTLIVAPHEKATELGAARIIIDLLKQSYIALERDAAPGIDGVTRRNYREKSRSKAEGPARADSQGQLPCRRVNWVLDADISHRRRCTPWLRARDRFRCEADGLGMAEPLELEGMGTIVLFVGHAERIVWCEVDDASRSAAFNGGPLGFG